MKSETQFVYLVTIIRKSDAMQLAAFVGKSRADAENACRKIYGDNLTKIFPKSDYNIFFTVEVLSGD